MFHSRMLAPMVVLLLSSIGHGAVVEMLTNRGFENASDHSLNWTVVSPVLVNQYPSYFNSPGAVPTGNGPWGLSIVQNGGTTGSFQQGNVQQIVNVAPGTYTFDASVWVRVYDNSIDSSFSRVRFRLLVDGVQVEQIDLQGPNTTGAGWTPWTKLQTQIYTMPVASSLGVFLQLRADGTGSTNNWGQVAADVFSLEAELVPEPASLLLLATAVVPLTLGKRRKPA